LVEYGLNVPRTLEEVCDPRRMALLVYDMQVGIVSQLPHGPEIVARLRRYSKRRAREGSGCSSAATCRCPRS
jgi:isochorismate hydrolase